MEMQEGLTALKNLLGHYDWFHEVCVEGTRYVVYAHRIGSDVEDRVPSSIMGRQVVVHFASAKLATREQFVENFSMVGIKRGELFFIGAPTSPATTYYAPTDSDNEVDVPTGSLSELTEELENLEKMCGSNILSEIFFEVHDKHNAITNLSAKYPEVRQAMETLYEEYGFDVLYDNLDG
jgi:hypothetical protein